MTTITIEFNQTITPERLEELLGDIYAQCSEDHDKGSWTEDGQYTITTKEN